SYLVNRDSELSVRGFWVKDGWSEWLGSQKMGYGQCDSWIGWWLCDEEGALHSDGGCVMRREHCR
ncbi:hypothetical protein L195_g024268, partial [Trifolium pratense]